MRSIYLRHVPADTSYSKPILIFNERVELDYNFHPSSLCPLKGCPANTELQKKSSTESLLYFRKLDSLSANMIIKSIEDSCKCKIPFFGLLNKCERKYYKIVDNFIPRVEKKIQPKEVNPIKDSLPIGNGFNYFQKYIIGKDTIVFITIE